MVLNILKATNKRKNIWILSNSERAGTVKNKFDKNLRSFIELNLKYTAFCMYTKLKVYRLHTLFIFYVSYIVKNALQVLHEHDVQMLLAVH